MIKNLLNVFSCSRSIYRVLSLDIEWHLPSDCEPNSSHFLFILVHTHRHTVLHPSLTQSPTVPAPTYSHAGKYVTYKFSGKHLSPSFYSVLCYQRVSKEALWSRKLIEKHFTHPCDSRIHTGNWNDRYTLNYHTLQVKITHTSLSKNMPSGV